MNLIIGFYRSTRGRILLDGRDMNELDLRSYRRYLAVVPQDTILFSGSVRDNITYGMKNGECIEMGTFEELMSRKGEFFRLKSLQS